jgi:hypothetical protein
MLSEYRKKKYLDNGINIEYIKYLTKNNCLKYFWQSCILDIYFIEVKSGIN